MLVPQHFVVSFTKDKRFYPNKIARDLNETWGVAIQDHAEGSRPITLAPAVAQWQMPKGRMKTAPT